MNTFHRELVKTLNTNLYNYYIDNFDSRRFNKGSNRIKDYFINWLTRFGIQNRSISLDGLAGLTDHLDALALFYEMLEDKKSKELLTLIFAYRILGHRKIKLPLSDSNFKMKINEIEHIKQVDDFIDPGFKNFLLHKYDLRALGIPIEFYFTAIGIWHDFVAKQYEYKADNKIIKAIQGDVVFDCGGCWADTALYFSNEIGESGKVYSFEFVESNMALFKKNISLNPKLSERITLIPRPVWSEPDLPFYVIDKGPASTVSLDPIKDAVRVNSQTIDAAVNELDINQVDFIKMDIEGAELNALKGAVHTLKKFRPKLAIALYHNIADFYTIPFWLSELGLGYKFYLGHYSIHSEETILFAEVQR